MANKRFVPPVKARIVMTPLEAIVVMDALSSCEPSDPQESKAINRVRSRLGVELVRVGRAGYPYDDECPHHTDEWTAADDALSHELKAREAACFHDKPSLAKLDEDALRDWYDGRD